MATVAGSYSTDWGLVSGERTDGGGDPALGVTGVRGPQPFGQLVPTCAGGGWRVAREVCLSCAQHRRRCYIRASSYFACARFTNANSLGIVNVAFAASNPASCHLVDQHSDAKHFPGTNSGLTRRLPPAARRRGASKFRELLMKQCPGGIDKNPLCYFAALVRDHRHCSVGAFHQRRLHIGWLGVVLQVGAQHPHQGVSRTACPAL